MQALGCGDWAPWKASGFCKYQSDKTDWISDLSVHFYCQLKREIKSFIAFSIAIEESMDTTDVAQLAIFICGDTDTLIVMKLVPMLDTALGTLDRVGLAVWHFRTLHCILHQEALCWKIIKKWLTSWRWPSKLLISSNQRPNHHHFDGVIYNYIYIYTLTYIRFSRFSILSPRKIFPTNLTKKTTVSFFNFFNSLTSQLHVICQIKNQSHLTV